MFGRGVAGGSARDASVASARSWGAYGDDMAGILGRLRWSATTALLISPVGILLISVVRLLIISDFNSATASAIASSGGYVNTVLGTVIPLVPILVPYLALVLLLFNRVVLGVLTLLAVACVIPITVSRQAAWQLAQQDWRHVVAFMSQPAGILALVVLGAPLAIMLIFELAGLGVATFMRTVAAMACIVLLPFISRLYPFPLSNQFYTQMLRQPWLPAEVITLTSGRTVVGYSLSDDGNWIVVLQDSNRAITYYRASDVAHRQICQMGEAASMPPLIPLFTAVPATGHTPACPKPPGAT